jgi:hypothetical protein
VIQAPFAALAGGLIYESNLLKAGVIMNSAGTAFTGARKSLNVADRDEAWPTALRK